MRRIRRILSIILMTGLLFCSCSTTPANYGTEALTEKQIASKQTKAMQKGHAYIHDGNKLHDLMELQFVHCGIDIDPATWPSLQEKLAEVQNRSCAFIITFTVVGYTEQFQLTEEDSRDPYCDYDTYTNLRVDEIHYMGNEVSLTEGETYCFCHRGAWVTRVGTEYKYSLYPKATDKYGVFRYGHQYIMSGIYNAENNRLYVNNNLGWNEICSDEEAQSFWEQYPKMAAGHVTSADQLFEPGGGE